MRIAVIGGSGFIGTSLIKVLTSAGNRVVNLDTERQPEGLASEFRRGSVENLEDVKAALSDVDLVYLLAAVHRDDVKPLSRYFEVNVNGARNVAAAAEEARISKIIFTSSVAIYGLDAPNATEDTTPAPFNSYGLSKLAAERELINWQSKDAGRSLTIVRPVVVFGPGNRGNVYNLLRQIGSKYFAMIGAGQNRKSMAAVENVASFLMYVSSASPGLRFFNYADKPDLSMNEFLTAAAALRGNRAYLRIPVWLALVIGHMLDALGFLTGRSFPISAVRVKKFCADTTIDSTRALASGFRPVIELPQAIQQMIDHEFK